MSILDRYVYGYDMLGNKTSITKERRGLLEESGLYAYGYDALGRLSQIQKDGQIQTRYGYDAFGNRTWKEEAGERTTYRHNALNQLLSETRDGRQTQYGYDRRGNLTSIVENGKCQKQYIYGALNRLEEAVNSVGKVARYQYNGLGHRVGKQEGLLPEEKIQKLDPQKRVEIEVGNFTQIQYTLDLTRQYHNLLERTEEERTQTYFWDGNVASYEENGETNYYLQDELGSPLRIADGEGAIHESYGYGAFGEDLYRNQGDLQPFGYTGYQRDQVAGTYYAQAREYQVEVGRFAEQDLIAGFVEAPFSMNRYNYCFNAPMVLVDWDGAWPSYSDIINSLETAGNILKDVVSDVAHCLNENIIKKYIIGTDRVVYKTNLGGATYEVTEHEGADLFVLKQSKSGEFLGWSLNMGYSKNNLSCKLVISGEGLNPLNWKIKTNEKLKSNCIGLNVTGSLIAEKKGLGYSGGVGGTSGTMPLKLPDDTVIKDFGSVNWSLIYEREFADWTQLGEGVISLAAIVALMVVVLDDGTGIGALDNTLIPGILTYLSNHLPALADGLMKAFGILVPTTCMG